MKTTFTPENWAVVLAFLLLVAWSLVMRRITRRQRPFRYRLVALVTSALLAAVLTLLTLDLVAAHAAAPTGAVWLIVALGGFCWAILSGIAYGYLRLLNHTYS